MAGSKQNLSSQLKPRALISSIDIPDYMCTLYMCYICHYMFMSSHLPSMRDFLVLQL